MKKKSHHIVPMIIMFALAVVAIYFINIYWRANQICEAIEKDEFVLVVDADRTKKAPEWLTKVVSYLNQGEEINLSHYRVQGGYCKGNLEGTLMVGEQKVELTSFVLRHDISLLNVGDTYNRVRDYAVGDSMLMSKLVPEWTLVPYVSFDTLGQLTGNEKLKNSDWVNRIEQVSGELKPSTIFGMLLAADEKSLMGTKYSYHITGEDNRIALLEKVSGKNLQLSPDTDIQLTIEIQEKDKIGVDMVCNKLPEGEYENVVLHADLNSYQLQDPNPEYVKEEDAEVFIELFELIKAFFL